MDTFKWLVDAVQEIEKDTRDYPGAVYQARRYAAQQRKNNNLYRLRSTSVSSSTPSSPSTKSKTLPRTRSLSSPTRPVWRPRALSLVSPKPNIIGILPETPPESPRNSISYKPPSHAHQPPQYTTIPLTPPSSPRTRSSSLRILHLSPETPIRPHPAPQRGHQRSKSVMDSIRGFVTLDFLIPEDELNEYKEAQKIQAMKERNSGSWRRHKQNSSSRLRELDLCRRHIDWLEDQEKR